MPVPHRNLITDVPGLKVGNAEDTAIRTGVTVLLPDEPAIIGVDVRGGAPGTRETDALDPTSLVEHGHAVVLSGGSMYGLDAASGVAAWLGARGIGFTGFAPDAPPVMLVPAAILFDLGNGGDKAWGDTPPYRDLGLKACEAAADHFDLGNAGAGFGATAGTYKGGLGSASEITGAGISVGAIAGVNPVGSPVMPGTQAFWAWPHEVAGEFGGLRPPDGWQMPDTLPADTKLGAPLAPGQSTIIGAVATDAALTKSEATRLANMAHAGIARAVWPSHTLMDGDTIFCLSVGSKPLPEPRAVALSWLGARMASCMARAIARGVWEAESLGDAPSIRKISGG